MELDLSQPMRKVLTTNNMHRGKSRAAGQHPSTVAHDHEQLPGTSNRYNLLGNGRMAIDEAHQTCHVGTFLMNLRMPCILKGRLCLVKHMP